jgi:Ca2+-binding EF-hand superfamily protein
VSALVAQETKPPAAPLPGLNTPPAMMSAKRPTNAELLKRFDKNGDGKIDDDERAAARETMLQEQMERQMTRAALFPGGEAALRARVLEMFDKNRDGTLDDEERAAAQKFAAARGLGPNGDLGEALMKRFDKNGNGRIDEDERPAVREFFAKEFALAAPAKSEEEKKRLDAVAGELAKRRQEREKAAETKAQP